MRFIWCSIRACARAEMSPLPPPRCRAPRVAAARVSFAPRGIPPVLAPLLAPNAPQKQHLTAPWLPPPWSPAGDAAFPLGTDSLGRCVLSRLLYGARVAMT